MKAVKYLRGPTNDIVKDKFVKYPGRDDRDALNGPEHSSQPLRWRDGKRKFLTIMIIYTKKRSTSGHIP